MQTFYQVADSRPLDQNKLAGFFADNFTDHDPQPGHAASSGEKMAMFYGLLLAASEDAVHEITFIEPVGPNKALVRWKWKGTHTGDLFGVPASGNRFDIAGMELWEFDDAGKITGLWHVEDLSKLFAQVAQK
ncbi:ester cyclase [Aliamphritea spongicola]|uniref:ester cyclase n=1 Tax=Aliamphritea spongicola TaxID=707589 RepID=UPI00196B05FA|nr:ester cyclase [Aliamphritea spongicola]MBN3562887.1 ester cyclase [Aliamphritea spongicola]